MYEDQTNYICRPSLLNILTRVENWISKPNNRASCWGRPWRGSATANAASFYAVSVISGPFNTFKGALRLRKLKCVWLETSTKSHLSRNTWILELFDGSDFSSSTVSWMLVSWQLARDSRYKLYSMNRTWQLFLPILSSSINYKQFTSS